VTSLHAGLRERGDFTRTCEIATALGTDVLGGSGPLLAEDRDFVLGTLREHGVRLGYENHPEPSPEVMLEQLGPDEGGVLGTALDTGWYATQSCDPVEAIERLAGRIVHVHLKDVQHHGMPHETCRFGQGVVDVEACVRALQRTGYEGDLMVEHEPEHHDPTEDCREMLPMVRGWLAA